MAKKGNGFDLKFDMRQVEALFEELAQTPEKADQTTEEFCRDVVKSAQLRAPVATGKLKWSIRSTRNKQNEHIIEAGAPYAGFVEYGTRNMAPQPFIEPAIRVNMAKYLDQLKKDAEGE